MGIFENFFFFPLALAISLSRLLTFCAICFLICYFVFGCCHRSRHAYDEDPE